MKALDEAIKKLDDQCADRAVRSIRGLIRLQPSRVNGFLSATAKHLPLERLISTFEDARKNLKDTELVIELDVALHALRNIFPLLRGAIALHDRWQLLENELWGADASMQEKSQPCLDDFTIYWENAKPLIRALEDGEPDSEWAQGTKKYASEVDAALPSDIEAARIAYSRFRNNAITQFFKVDHKLLEFCFELVGLETPLEALLGEIER